MSEVKVDYEVGNSEEMEAWKVDSAIEQVKDINEEINKLKDILDKRTNDLKLQFENKKESLLKQNQFLLTTLGEFARTQKLKKTKTQSKYTSLAGDVVIKHAKQNPKKPDKNKIDKIEKVYPELIEVEEVKKLNWRELKSRLIIQDGKVFDKETGEDVSGLVDIEVKGEEVLVK